MIMPTIKIQLSDEQYQQIKEEISYAGRLALEEETFGGYELCLQIPIPNIFPSTLEMKLANTIDLGEVEWQFKT